MTVPEVLCAAFGCMLLGAGVHRRQMLSDVACKGVATLYAKLVFPTMVFVGVSQIDVSAVDRSLLIVVFASKAALALLVVAFGIIALRSSYGFSGAIAHAAAWAMAASHSFDVTLGVPLAKVLYPELVDYLYLNQSVQLVLINPVLLTLMELGKGSGSGSGHAVAALRAVATNPLVVMTVLGLAAGQAFPAGLPSTITALVKQVAAAGPFLGNLALGFALATVGGTSRADAAACCALCAAKLVVMPLLYGSFAKMLGCTASPAFLAFLGTLPASASVYSLTLIKDLSPRVVGPLVPVSIVLCVALTLLPLSPIAAELCAADGLRLAIALIGLVVLPASKPLGASVRSGGAKKTL